MGHRALSLHYGNEIRKLKDEIERLRSVPVVGNEQEGETFTITREGLEAMMREAALSGAYAARRNPTVHPADLCSVPVAGNELLPEVECVSLEDGHPQRLTIDFMRALTSEDVKRIGAVLEARSMPDHGTTEEPDHG